ncbi:hypothetical protein OG788_07925 [Streptomyces sp. NBC_00647]|uniref:hypothetical protein n=1 Tax=Streptomyces sp. NBC_00647 TaxID=2975796 RepID=UPI0032509846
MQSENTGLQARLGQDEEHRAELRETIRRLEARLDAERECHRQEAAALRERLDAPGAAAGPAAGPGDDGPVSAPAPGRAAEPEPDAGGESPGRGPVAVVDLGVHGGSGCALVRYPDDLGSWRVLRDGEIAGTLRPEHSLHGTSLLGWSARTSHAIPPHPPFRQNHFANREQAAGAVIRHHLTTASTRPAAAAVIPLATATEERGGRLARLPEEVRAAALRTALRVPGEDDLTRLTALDEAALGRGKEAQALFRALEDLRPQSPVQEAGPIDLGVIGGRAWRLEPPLRGRLPGAG